MRKAKKKAKKKKVSKKKRATKRKVSRAPALTVDRRKLSQLLTCSLRYVSQLEAEGVLVALHRGRGGRPSTYALEAVIPAYIAHVKATKEPSPRDKRDLEQAAILRSRREREEGQLWRRDDIIAACRGIIETVKARLRRLPYELVRADVIPATGKEIAIRAVDDALRELARITRVTGQ